MDVTLRVNRVSTHSVERAVTYKGQHAMAMVPEMQVEMHDETGTHGSFTLHLTTVDEIAEAKALFTGCEFVTVSVVPAAVVPAVNTDVTSDAATDSAASTA